MGVERLFKSLKTLDTTQYGAFLTIFKEKLLVTHFLIDFNSIVYVSFPGVLADLNYVLYHIITNNINNKTHKIVKDYNITLYDNPADFKKQFTQELLDDIIIEKVLEYLINKLKNYIVSSNLKEFYIAIDGVPSFAKLAEQKKRRYGGILFSLMRSTIFKKYEEDFKKDNIRYTFMKNKITWLSINITPGTEFMQKMNEALISKKFRKAINSTCKNLEKYTLSGSNESGEGEHKIVNHLRSMSNPKGKFLIYSPDGDFVFLSLILHTAIPPSSNNKITNLSILRYNQQRSNYAVIDIKKLGENIFQHILEQINVTDKDSVIRDISLIFSLFGNDFIPKIVSLDISYDFKKLMNMYVSILKQNNKQHLISHDGTKFVINQAFLLDVFKILKTEEGHNLQKTYMSNNYKNYERLKNIMGASHTNFTQVLNEFLSNLRTYNNSVRSIENMAKEDIDKFVEEWTKKDKEDFIKKLKKLTKMGIDARKINDDKFIHHYIEYYKRQKKMPYVAINLVKRSKSIKDKYHKMKLEKKLDYLDPNLKITPYDEEVYKLDNMLDEYKKKLNAQELNLGYIDVDLRTYTFKSEKIVKSVSRYYKTFFDIDDVKGKKMDDLVQNYIEGFLWVLNWYYNNYDIEFNRHNANTWYYKYRRAPLASQIYWHLKKNNEDKDYIKKISDNLEKEYWVDRSEYFNSLEQLMYVSPVQMKSIQNIVVPEEYISFVKTSKYYSDLDKVTKSIMSDIKSDEIDCIGALYSSKCHFKVISTNNFETDKEFIQDIRKIKLSKETEKRRGEYNPEKSNINIFLIKKKALSRSNINDYNALYQKYKQKYKETGHYAYKNIYEFIENNLLK
uniref:XRN 5'-3' exonuclease n=1 Tax=Mimivirus LCMiAC02 TaxID=2506609 RepID=A0A481Z1Z9_9VIRU|nr:MAG: XRN 5'-3' exonuclease [Mimivirus LCMiAC02]